ncbi:hypothetical protein NMY22_g5723 [Coprinellus aureogranulatus]|nr:hypothetical protein NMY22_g5723 [Coprinellus aureogranulatus]
MRTKERPGRYHPECGQKQAENGIPDPCSTRHPPRLPRVCLEKPIIWVPSLASPVSVLVSRQRVQPTFVPSKVRILAGGVREDWEAIRTNWNNLSIRERQIDNDIRAYLPPSSSESLSTHLLATSPYPTPPTSPGIFVDALASS